ncbi:hypothetical protein T12_17130 [Trichinella patagoniensis]|uniref:Uncharacterized protein n=1 Tax=Trichinella patagoniensis TaxID=990121 RepID=A0A0V0Z988_9BILA|nr:hypothetical protein T12_17130 [Trichinella patagoniensis]
MVSQEGDQARESHSFDSNEQSSNTNDNATNCELFTNCFAGLYKEGAGRRLRRSAPFRSEHLKFTHMADFSPRHWFFYCMTSGQCANWSNLAAVLDSDIFCIATTCSLLRRGLSKKIFFGTIFNCSAHNMPVKSTRPMYLLYSFTIADTSTKVHHHCTDVLSDDEQVVVCSGADVEGTPTSLF